MKSLLNEIKAMNRIAGTELTKEQEIAIIRERLEQLKPNKLNEDVKSLAKQLLSKSKYDEKEIWKLSDTADDIIDGLSSDRDSKELASKLKKDKNGVYVQTDEMGGHILFNSGEHYEIQSDEGGTIEATKK